MNEMLERVARKLSGADDRDGHEWYHVNPEYWTRLARAALKELRNFDVLSLDLENPQPMFFDDAWVEVFDDALKEPVNASLAE